MNRVINFKNVVIAMIMAWILAFIVAPNLLVTLISFLVRDSHDIVGRQFTLENYLSLINPTYYHIFIKTFVYAAVTTLICLVIGFPFAFILTRSGQRYRKILLMMVIIPFWTSSLIRTYALIIILKANGIINTSLKALGLIDRPLEILYTDLAVYIGLVYTLLPFMILPLYASLEKLDTRLLEAAYDLGARPVQVFSRVILPLSLPGVMAGSIMVFIPAMGLFYLPDLLGGAKSMLLGNLIKNQFLVAHNWPFGAAVSCTLTLIMLAMLFVYFKTMKRFNASLMEGA